MQSTTRLRNATEHMLEVRIGSRAGDETVHPLEPRGALPMPITAGRGGYCIKLRPVDADDVEWSASFDLPDAAPPLAENSKGDMSTVALSCSPRGNASSTWHCLVHREALVLGAGVPCHEVSIQPPLVLTNLLSTTLEFELRGSGTALSGRLESGGSQRAHAFARRSPVALVAQVHAMPPSITAPLLHLIG